MHTPVPSAVRVMVQPCQAVPCAVSPPVAGWGASPAGGLTGRKEVWTRRRQRKQGGWDQPRLTSDEPVLRSVTIRWSAGPP